MSSPLRRGGADVRQQGARCIHHGQAGGIGGLQDLQVGRPASVHVHDIVLHREGVMHKSDVTHQHGYVVYHLDGHLIEQIDRRWTRVHHDVVVDVPEPGGACRDQQIRSHQCVYYVVGRDPLGGHQRRIDVDLNLSQRTAEGGGCLQTGDREKFDPNEVQRVVEDLCLGQRLAAEDHLHDGDGGGIGPDHDWRSEAGRHDAKRRAVDRIDLSDRRPDIGALVEVNLDQPCTRYAVGFDALDAVDCSGVGALADDHDAAFHLLGRQARVVPAHEYDRDVDLRKEVDDHLLHRQIAEQQDQQRKHGNGIRPAQCQPHECHHVDRTPFFKLSAGREAARLRVSTGVPKRNHNLCALEKENRNAGARAGCT